MLRRLLLRRLAEAQPVGDEKLTADDEENDDAAENVGKRLVEPERGRDLARAAVEEHEQEAREDHTDGVELCQPRDHDGREALAAGDGGRDRVVGAGHEQHACNAAQRAGQGHRAHIDARDADTGVACGILRVADDGDLIAVLAVVEV